jgi:hypothetical protein
MRHKAKAATKSSTFNGSAEAKRLAAAILEGLAGVRGPQEASEALGISMTRYYHLETRALQGLVASLEPRPRGRRRSPLVEISVLEREKARLERELKRAQALVRTAQRTIGLPPPRREGKLGPDGKPGRRTRRAMVRATKVAEALRQAPVATESGTASKEA